LQPVYFFGFPFGAGLGKQITVNPATVSSLRKDDSGELQEIQLNGNVNPGNSGGPVVDARGAVVGVSVRRFVNGGSGVGIGFAVPADFIKPALDGRLDEITLGEPYLDNGQGKLPVKLSCLDPLGRVKGVKLDYWTGVAGAALPTSFQPPGARPGDSARQAVAVNYLRGAGQVDLPLPPLAVGQVLWLQPVLNHGSTTQWARALPYQSKGLAPLERKPTLLQLKNPAGAEASERTLHLKSTAQIKVIEGKRAFLARDTIEVDALEVAKADPEGSKTQIFFANATASGEEDGKPFQRHPTALALMSRLDARFLLGPDGAFKTIWFSNRTAQDPLAEPDLADLYNKGCNVYQSCCLVLPNRNLAVGEAWPARTTMLLGKKGQKKESIDLALTCTYEGVRVNNGHNEAFVRLTGDVKKKNAGPAAGPGGKVKGFVLFDVDNGYVSQANFGINTVLETDNFELIISQDIELSRVPGNVHNLKTWAPGTPQPGLKNPVVKGKTVLNIVNQLTPTDPKDNARPGQNIPRKIHPHQFEAGKTYIIEMNMQPGTTLDPYLRLEDRQGKILAEDDDSGGDLNSKIVFTAPASGYLNVIATTLGQNQYGGYTLTISESASGPGPGPGPLAKGKLLLNVSAKMDLKSPIDPRKPGCRCQIFNGKLEGGKKYVIEMNKVGVGRLDPVLRLEDDKGNVVAEDNDSGGNLNARIVFTAPQSGAYRIYATTPAPNMLGSFHLTLTEVP
jgi:hypothetical protein